MCCCCCFLFFLNSDVITTIFAAGSTFHFPFFFFIFLDDFFSLNIQFIIFEGFVSCSHSLRPVYCVCERVCELFHSFRFSSKPKPYSPSVSASTSIHVVFFSLLLHHSSFHRDACECVLCVTQCTWFVVRLILTQTNQRTWNETSHRHSFCRFLSYSHQMFCVVLRLKCFKCNKIFR